MGTPAWVLADADDDAGKAELSKEQIQQLEMSVRIQSLLYEMRETVARDMAAGQTLSEEQWAAKLQQISEQVLNQALREEADAAERGRVWSFLRRLNWRTMANAVHRIVQNGNAAIRSHGVPGVAALVTEVVMDFGVPLALMAAGRPDLIPVVSGAIQLVPDAPAAYAVAYAIQQRMRMNRLIQLYGGRERYDQIQSARGEIRRQLGLYWMSDILVPLLSPEHGLQGAIVTHQWRIGRLLHWMGITRTRLTYNNLVGFLNTHMPNDGMVRAITGNRELSEDAKTVLLLNQVTQHQDRTLLSRLRTEFGRDMVELMPVTERGNRLREWALEFAKVKTIEEIVPLMQRVPAGAHDEKVARLWAEVILPTLIENIPEITARQAAALRRDFIALRAQAEVTTNGVADAAWIDRFQLYLGRVLPKALTCPNLASQIAP